MPESTSSSRIQWIIIPILAITVAGLAVRRSRRSDDPASSPSHRAPAAPIASPSAPLGSAPSATMPAATASRAPESAAPAASDDLHADAPLPPEEEKEFFAETRQFFSTGYTIMDGAAQAEMLSKLNGRMRRGVRSTINAILALPKDTDGVQDRRALVEYLGYRAKWDRRVRHDIVEVVMTPVDPATPINVLAMRIAENAELLRELARWDQDMAISTLSIIKDPVARRYAAVAIETGMLAQGVLLTEARERIRRVYPTFAQNDG